MRSLLTLIFISIVVVTNCAAKESNLILGDTEHQTCIVKDKETLFQGIMIAYETIEALESRKLIRINIDDVTYIKSEDLKADCKFSFEVAYDGSKLANAEIRLAKKGWRIKTRKLLQDNSSVSW